MSSHDLTFKPPSQASWTAMIVHSISANNVDCFVFRTGSTLIARQSGAES
ncbi:uncharacterized protein LACBIDRAFT_316009 [Laccaria bicolor S238N-H82]|uniref:Predicted protein n=1 Tax=Laccaria bicolor (strain S238N-H82 / ATCC MYA-4686) TaxID=486041 RepID=B0D3Q1_LACBS|nr:uncharacterized protein LACBIDRAFT_316009 [Laccaria bicolor S238N-H82]EDR11308.1 predicted protein [Laccaria bicolor S238N-H82]|eukprot:XP_001878609.1 predicted protein [Laccaria bicolor S238N-H82]